MSLSPVGREEKYVPFSWYASWLASPTPSATRPLSWRSLRTLADRLSGTKNVTVLRSGCTTAPITQAWAGRSEEHTSELQSQSNLVCRLLLEKKKTASADGETETTKE